MLAQTKAPRARLNGTHGFARCVQQLQALICADPNLAVCADSHATQAVALQATLPGPASDETAVKARQTDGSRQQQARLRITRDAMNLVAAQSVRAVQHVDGK